MNGAIQLLLLHAFSKQDLWRSGGIATHILNLGTRLRGLASFTPWRFYSRVKRPTIVQGSTCSRRQLWIMWKKNSSVLLQGMDLRSLGHPVWSRGAISLLPPVSSSSFTQCVGQQVSFLPRRPVSVTSNCRSAFIKFHSRPLTRPVCPKERLLLEKPYCSVSFQQSTCAVQRNAVSPFSKGLLLAPCDPHLDLISVSFSLLSFSGS
jgi:hypothetical protein